MNERDGGRCAFRDKYGRRCGKRHDLEFHHKHLDVAAMRNALKEADVEAGPIARPFCAPGGEFRVMDPDGCVLMVTHT